MDSVQLNDEGLSFALRNGEELHMASLDTGGCEDGDALRIVFETSDFADMSPATIARCGVVNVGSISWLNGTTLSQWESNYIMDR